MGLKEGVIKKVMIFFSCSLNKCGYNKALNGNWVSVKKKKKVDILRLCMY